MKQIAIIDDEKDAREVLRTLLEWCPGVEVVGEADGVASGYALLQQLRPTAVFLDISMNDGTGFDLLDKFPQPPCQIVFVTAHDAFALRAFRYHALDYLMKPIDPKELLRAVERISAGHRMEDLARQLAALLEGMKTRKLEKVALHAQEGLIYLRTDQIVHLQSEGSYTTFYMLGQERHVASRSIKEFEDMLCGEEGFFRIHQSHIVNLSFVKRVLREDGGYAQMETGAKLPIARRRKEEFLQALGG
jgi:two-component system, LytTR family, response regulator